MELRRFLRLGRYCEGTGGLVPSECPVQWSRPGQYTSRCSHLPLAKAWPTILVWGRSIGSSYNAHARQEALAAALTAPVAAPILASNLAALLRPRDM